MFSDASRGLVLVCYDIVQDDRRSRVASTLEAYGNRVQYSVFEVYVSQSTLRELRRQLEAMLDSLTDRITFYRLCTRDVALRKSAGITPLSREFVYEVF